MSIHKRTKDDAHNAAIRDALVARLHAPGVIIGTVAKDVAVVGKFADEYRTALLGSASSTPPDIAPGLAGLLAPKDSDEMRICSAAARFSSLIMRNYFVGEMSSYIDSGKKVSHERFSLLIESTLLDERKRASIKIPADVLSSHHFAALILF